ncbi:Ubiquitin domain-containing protein 2 [Boothiomyces sp. JEL0866]|nr:Ubiquitin domain-containing protein 2 [Boothiomyces sp. JEL0866]
MGGCCSSPEQEGIPLEPTSGNIPTGSNKPLKPFNTYVKPSTEEYSVIMHKRDTFWETQPSYSGRLEIWQTLRLACETEQIETSQAIIDSVNMTCPTGRLTDGLYDTYGNHYIIPDYCIGIIENTNKSVKTELNDYKSLKSFSELDLTSEDGYSITVRLSTGSDIIITIDPEMKISTLKALVGKSLGYSIEDLKKLMVIHFGKVLENNTLIKDTKIAEKSVVQVMVIQM